MLPTLMPGTIVWAHTLRTYRPGQVVIAYVNGRDVIKRVIEISEGKIYLVADNPKASHPQRKYYAVITDDKIEGTVFWPVVKTILQ